MVDWRHLIDLTPWDKNGGSWMGLRRNTAKIIAIALITLAILMAFPPTIPSPDDLINVFLTKAMIKIFPSVSPLILMGLTYTIIPFTLLLLGLWIYPYNTRSLFNGKVNAAQRWIKSKTPTELILLILLSALMLYIYYKHLVTGGFIEQLLGKIT